MEKREEIAILAIKEIYIVGHSQSNKVNNFCDKLRLTLKKPSLEDILITLCLEDIFCYHKHYSDSFVRPICWKFLCADHHLHKIFQKPRSIIILLHVKSKTNMSECKYSFKGNSNMVHAKHLRKILDFVRQRTTGKVFYLVFTNFLQVLTKCLFR